MSKLKLTYERVIGNHHIAFNYDELLFEEGEIIQYTIDPYLAESWTIGEEYIEGVDFSITQDNNGEYLLVPYLDPNQLKLFDPCEL